MIKPPAQPRGGAHTRESSPAGLEYGPQTLLYCRAMSPLPPFPIPGSSAAGVRATLSVVLAAVFSVAGTDTARAQLRIGLSLGGASTVALLAEYRWDHRGLEAQAGTWQFRDLSLSVTGKQYVGSHAAEPFVGAGLWAIVALAEEGTGYALIGRIPVGLDWEVATRHSVAFTVYLNRALALKRPDPEDLRPPRTSLIPLPEVAYRWHSER